MQERSNNLNVTVAQKGHPMPPRQGEIVSVWTEGSDTCMAVAVQESETQRVEYIGRVPTAELEGKTRQERKQVLRQAVKAARERQVGPASRVVSDLTGTIDL